MDDFKNTFKTSMSESHSCAFFHGDPIGKFCPVWTLCSWCWHVFLPRLRKFPCAQYIVLNLWAVRGVLDHFCLVCVRVNSQLSWKSEGGTSIAKSPQLTESRRTLTVQGVFRETHSPKSLKTSEKGNLMTLKWRKDN